LRGNLSTSGLKHRDADVIVFAQPGSDHTSGRAASNHYEIELVHGSLS
jgi:hypothetical protein